MNFIFGNSMILFAIVVLWVVTWKIYAVWLAARRGDRKWFIVLLLINTLSILELIYIFKVAGKTWPEIKAVFNRRLKDF